MRHRYGHDGVIPYTEIGGPYNEARINQKHVEAEKKRKAREVKKAKEAEEKQEQGQEM